MRAFVIAAIVALLTAPAYGQVSFEEKTKADKAAREDADRGYRPAADRIPEQKGVVDPWASVRGAEQPTAGKPKKPAGSK